MNPTLKQEQQALMQQAMLQQQEHLLHHSGVLSAAMSQMAPVPTGNLPPGFLHAAVWYMGNIHPAVTESLLAEVFQSIGALEGFKLIQKEKNGSSPFFSSCDGSYINISEDFHLRCCT